MLLFVTRLLGLVAGDLPIKVEAGPEVKAVQVQLDGKTIAKLSGPPWISTVDFGKELAPHELTAIAFDAHGVEVARDTQAAKPVATTVALDGQPVAGT